MDDHCGRPSLSVDMSKVYFCVIDYFLSYLRSFLYPHNTSSYVFRENISECLKNYVEHALSDIYYGLQIQNSWSTVVVVEM